MLKWYENNVELGKTYIRMNSIKYLEVQKHHLGDPGFQLWEMKDENSGSPTSYPRKKDAVEIAKKLAKIFNLPLIINGKEVSLS